MDKVEMIQSVIRFLVTQRICRGDIGQCDDVFRALSADDRINGAEAVFRFLGSKNVLVTTQSIESLHQQWNRWLRGDYVTMPVADPVAVVNEPDTVVVTQRSGATTTPSLPRTLGDHLEVIKMIGQGGMGVVSLCRDTVLGRQVVVKLSKATERDDRERFRREAQAMAALQHPNVGCIHEVLVHDGNPLLVMEFIEGKNLRDAVLSNSWSLEKTLQVFRDVVRGVAAIHQAGMVHRDLKPANAMVRSQNDQGVVLDLGLVRAVGEAQADGTGVKPDIAALAMHLSRTGDAAGTPAFMSPEQIMGFKVDARADVYALGKILYFMFARDYLHGDTREMIALVKAITQEPLPNSFYQTLRDNRVPNPVMKIITKCLEREAAERYADAGKLFQALEQYFLDVEEAKRKKEVARKLATQEAEGKAAKMRLLAIGSAIGVLLMLVAVLGLVYAWQQAETSRQAQTKAAEESEARAQAETKASDEAKARLATERKQSRVAKRFAKALSSIESARWHEARTELGEIVKIAPEYFPARAMLAQVLFNFQQADCEKHWQWLLENGPREQASEYGFYVVFHGSNLQDPEPGKYDSVLARITDRRYSLLAQAYLHMMEKPQAREAALAKLNELGEDQASDWLALYMCGYIHAMDQSMASQIIAKKLLGRSVALNPDFAMSYFWHAQVCTNLGNALKDAGNVEATKAYLDQAGQYFERLLWLMPEWSPGVRFASDNLVERSLLESDVQHQLELAKTSLALIREQEDRGGETLPRRVIDLKLARIKSQLCLWQIHAQMGNAIEARATATDAGQLIDHLEFRNDLIGRQTALLQTLVGIYRRTIRRE